MRLLLSFGLGCALAATACTAESTPSSLTASEDEVRIDTRSPLARAQYDANLAFARGYRPICTTRRTPGVKRVLITGFGRFLAIADNASGRVVSALTGVRYPETEAPAAGAVDAPGPQLSVGVSRVRWPRSGSVEICAMVLPVMWDVAPLLLLRELEAFRPDVVLMNGVAGERQDLWIELGAVNDARPLEDGSGIQTPYDQRNAAGDVPILRNAPRTHPNRMSWSWATERARAALQIEAAADPELGAVLTGVGLAGFPRASNTYLCNNLTFVTSYLMDAAGAPANLLVASDPIEGRANSVRVALRGAYADVPRTFLHWPRELTFEGRPQKAARVLEALADAQLAATAEHPAIPGDNALAAAELAGGDTF